MSTATFRIEGMYCERCAERIARVVDRAPGVAAADVSFAAGEARIRYNPHVVSEATLAELIVQAGFSVIG